MPRALPKSHRDVRKAVVDLLRHIRRFARLFSAESIANLLNTAAEIDDSTVPRFTKEIVTAAFSTGGEESVIPLANFGIEHSNAIIFTHSSQRNQRGVKRQTTIGCFSTVEEARAASVEKALPSLNLIPDNQRNELTKFLKGRPTKVSQSNEASQSNDDESVDDSVPAHLLEEALDQIEQLEQQLRQSRKRPVSPNADESPSYNRAKTTFQLRYLLNGEAGVVEIDSNQKSISVDSLLTGIKREHHYLVDII